MKFKKIPKEYYTRILDILTRFEPACIRYKRVFDDIINKFSLDDKIKNLSDNQKLYLVEEIFNNSFNSNDFDSYLHNLLFELEDKYFFYNEESYQYLSIRLNLSQMIKEVEISNKTPKNVIWLKEVYKNREDITKLRQNKGLGYPIEKIILCEGQTEFVLLETIFKLYNIDFNKLGCRIIPAGGKNQVARKYYSMIEYTKLPFFILLDKDAYQTAQLIAPKLRSTDKLYLIQSGEFEDLIPSLILYKTINYIHKNEQNCAIEDFLINGSMVESLENIYRKYGYGEFKKAQFALWLKEYIDKFCTKEDFLSSEIVKIILQLTKK